MEELISIHKAKEDLLSCAIYLAGNVNSNELQAETLKPIVINYLQQKDVDNAAHYADAITDSHTRNNLLVAVISKCVEIDDEDYAFQLIEAIDEQGIREMAIGTIALQKAAKGDFDGAFELAASLNHSADILAGIAFHQVKKGFEDEAMKTLSEIDFYKSIVDALVELAADFFEQDKNEKTVEYLEKAFSHLDEIEFTEDKIGALLKIGSMFIDAEKNERGIETFTKAVAEIEQLDGTHKDALFGAAAVGFLRAGSIDLADSTLDSVEDKTQAAVTLLNFSDVFSKANDREEAIETLEEAYAILKSEKESKIRDSKSRFKLFGYIAIAFADFEMFERGLELAHENPAEAEKNSALTKIAQIAILKENDEMASQALKGIESDSQKMSALIAMSDAKEKVEKRDEAIELLDEATTLIDSLPQFIARTEAHNEVANRLGHYSQTDKARNIASESLHAIGEILGDNNRSVALTELSKVYGKYEFTPSDTDKEVLDLLVRKSNW